MARVWPDRVVEENNLEAQIVALRKALDANSTVSGRGYRFTGDIRTLPARPDRGSAAVQAASDPWDGCPRVEEVVGADGRSPVGSRFYAARLP
jgi:DNA-binding winged helix-turn-helix (wHTH) protein